jgi:hypothetical protein
MKENTVMNILISLACIFCIISINACETTNGGLIIGWEPDSEISHTHDTKKNGKGGPPPHAPAHGYRAKHTYHYYPDARVYFDISKEIYFYMKGQSWQVSAFLPGGLHVQLGDYVTIHMDSEKPYTRLKDHKKKYPPRQKKKKKDKWAKNK